MGHHQTGASNDFYTDLSVGEILRRARLQAGESIEQTAEALRIKVSYLQALERSDFKALPGSVYVIGFVRAYAEHVGLDGTRTVDLLKRQTEILNMPAELTVHVPVPENKLPSVPIVAAAFAAIVVVVAVWIAYQGARLSGADTVLLAEGPEKKIGAPDMPSLVTEPDSVPSAPDVEKPTVTAGPVSSLTEETTPAPVLPPTSPVEIKITAESWIELRAPDGKVTEARVFRAGEVIPIENPVDGAGKAYILTLSNAGGVEIAVDGKSLGPLGEKDRVRRNIALDPKTLKKLVGSE